MATRTIYLPLAEQAALARDAERRERLLEKVSAMRVYWHERAISEMHTRGKRRAVAPYRHWNDLTEPLNRLGLCLTHPGNGHPLMELGSALGEAFYRDLVTGNVLRAGVDPYAPDRAGTPPPYYFTCTWQQWMRGRVPQQFGALIDHNGFVLGRWEGSWADRARERTVRKAFQREMRTVRAR